MCCTVCIVCTQAEMSQKEQQIQALKSGCKSRPTLMPLLMNGVAHCERSVSKEVGTCLGPYRLASMSDALAATHACTARHWTGWQEGQK